MPKLNLKIFAFFALFFFTSLAHAGFITGLAIGSALSGSDANQNKQSTVIVSDKYDVITCEKATFSANCTLGSSGRRNSDRYTCANYSEYPCITPEEYAKENGYDVLHSVGITFIDGTQYLILEVSHK